MAWMHPIYTKRVLKYSKEKECFDGNKTISAIGPSTVFVTNSQDWVKFY